MVIIVKHNAVNVHTWKFAINRMEPVMVAALTTSKNLDVMVKNNDIWCFCFAN